MKALILEHAERMQSPSTGVIASGKSIAILGSKVCAVESGGRMVSTSDGGEDDYCTVYMDSGQVLLVCGTADRVLEWLGLETE